MHWVGTAVGIVILLVIAYYVVAFIGGAVWMFTVEAYREIRYSRKGICYKCKRQLETWRSGPADQTYGPDSVSQGSCQCGGRTLVRGNRRFADWADF